MDRRTFLRLTALGAAGWATGCPGTQAPPAIPTSEIAGKIHGQDDAFAHLLRTGELHKRPIAETIDVDVLILGGGVAGLTAAWRCRREGRTPTVIDAGRDAGGNSRWGELEGVTRYPWGAHYLRVPTKEHPSLERFLEEVGLLKGRDAKQRPDWDTRAICPSPHERIFESGLWGGGLFPPPKSTSPQDLKDFKKFDSLIDLHSKLVGTDGKRAFVIPLEESSRDQHFLDLDGVSFLTWFQAAGFTSKALRWLLDYSVRDDFGCTLETCSAWAGLHYFCARRSTDPTRDQIMAWPEGNGRLIQHLLAAKGGQPVQTRSLCFGVTPGARPGQVSEALVFHEQGERVVRYRARDAVWAGPRFVLERLVTKGPPQPSDFSYSPWLVANVVLRQPPAGIGAGLAWDNVFYESESLGYVVANRERAPKDPVVVTWYQVFAGADPRKEREALYALTHADIVERVCKDLFAAHPNLKGEVQAVEAWRWGHAMIRPTTGFLWTKRPPAIAREDALLCAHSDQSGISIFEEAFYRGVIAGEEILRRQGVSFESLLRPI